MKKRCRYPFWPIIAVALALIFLYGKQADAQLFSTGFINTVDGLVNISNIMLFDNTPMETHFKGQSWTLNITPAYMRPSRIFDIAGSGYGGGSTADGAGYDGWFVGASVYYCTSDSFLVFMSLSTMQSGGTFRVDPASFMPMRFSGHFDTYNAVIGGAYDFMGTIDPNSFFSMPLYYGWYMIYYDMKGNMAPYLPQNIITGYIRLQGRGPGQGPFLGTAIAFRLFGFIYVSLYGNVNLAVSSHPIYGTQVADNPHITGFSLVGFRESAAYVLSSFYSFGLRVSFRSESHISASLNISGVGPEIFPVYKYIYHGLEMRTYSLTVSYSTF